MGSLGSEQGSSSNEQPQHEVVISKGFYLGKYEITQGQWETVMGTQPWVGHRFVLENSSHPAVYISWEEVQDFVHRLNQAAGDSLYRLPTEAEWEYACRAGTTTRWSFGDDEGGLKDAAWYIENAWNAGEQYAHAVGIKLANPWGLYDMHGNVWEWVEDWFGEYSNHAQIDPTGAPMGTRRIQRGGSFTIGALALRSARRHGMSPSDRSHELGMRLLRIEQSKVKTMIRSDSWSQVKFQSY